MKILFIGGTGNISTACSKLSLERGLELTLLTRGQSPVAIEGAETLRADISKPEEVKAALGDRKFDVVVNFIAFTQPDVDRDIELFRGRTGQYVFISSASAYQKPLMNPVVTESTPLKNPFWQYSRDKIACEERLNQAYRDEDFPAVIVRPSLTYDMVWPIAIGGWNDFTLVDRIRRGGKIVVHGDGTSLWTVTHSEDFAKGLVGLFGNTNAIGHAFHITSDEILTWDQIYRTIADAAGVPDAPLVHIPSEFLAGLSDWERGNLMGDKGQSAIFDNSKIKQFVPEFKATIPFHVGARKTLKWFEADESRQTIVDGVNQTMDHYISEWEKACKAVGINV